MPRDVARRALIGLLVTGLCLGLPGPASADDLTSGPGPALSASPSTLRSAIVCSGSLAGVERDPVLLVHGTTSTGPESWRWGYYKALSVRGFPVCMVTLPGRAMGDIQHSSEWVVYAIRWMHQQSGRQVSVVGHSQGNLQPLWAMRFWPDIAPSVSRYVSLAGPFHGTTSSSTACAIPTGCYPVMWQTKPGSAFLKALFPGGGTTPPVGPAYTSVATKFDEVVNPAPQTSRLDGPADSVRNIVVQDLCPNRPIGHSHLLADAATFAIVMDALTHAGPADLSRVAKNVCNQTFIPKITPWSITAAFAVISTKYAQTLATTPVVHQPPPMKCYAGGPCDAG